MGIKLTLADLDFLWAQLNLPQNDPRNAPFGTILDPFGIRDVSGFGNNINNPFFGATDQLFVRKTPAVFKQAEGTFSHGPTGLNVVPVPSSSPRCRWRCKSGRYTPPPPACCHSPMR